MRVLLVEDDPVTATIVQALLRETGFACDVADLGEIGLTLAESYRDYDVSARFGAAGWHGLRSYTLVARCRRRHADPDRVEPA